MSAAKELGKYTERSNAIHQEYLSDPELLTRYEHFVLWQTDYMLPFYEDLRATEHYTAAVDFVVSDLTGLGVCRRDQDIARVVPVMSKMLPHKAVRAMASAMQLNASVLEINLQICRALFEGKSVGAEISETEYRSACKRASSLDECLHLVQLIEDVGHSLDRLIRIPMIGLTLKAMRSPARLAGFAALQDFLQKGYRTFDALEDVDQFLKDITLRMTEVFTEIFTADLVSDDQQH